MIFALADELKQKQTKNCRFRLNGIGVDVQVTRTAHEAYTEVSATLIFDEEKWF